MENVPSTPVYFPRKKIIILVGFIGVLFVSLLVVSLTSRNSNPPSSSPIPTPFQIQTSAVSPLQKTQVGKPLPDNFKNTVNIEKVEAGPDNQTIYSYTAPVAIRPNQVVTKNNIVVFERILTPEAPSSVGYATISEYKSHFGAADKEIRGSKLYGWYMMSYIYASHGFTIIGNPNTDEVYEVQHYLPMSVDEYIKTYGEDLDTDAQPPHE